MADLVVTTDFSQVNDLNTALKSTDTIFVKAVDSVIRESNRFNRVSKVLSKTTEETLAVIQKAEEIAAAKIQRETDRREKARKREAEAAEREAKRIEAAAKKAADAEAKLAAEIEKNQAISAQNFTSGVNQRAGVTGPSAIQSGASFSAMDQEIERLRQKYDQIYAASRLYESSLEELNRAHMLGVTSAKQHEAAVEQLNMEYQQFSSSAEGAYIANNRFSQHINQTGRGLNNFGFVAQQVGYQVGDFFVQVQSGTNVLVAFGQQATQLAGLIPGVWGAAIGIGISLVTALGAAWMRTNEEVSKGKEELESYKSALETLTSKSADAATNLEAIKRGVAPDEILASKLAIEALIDTLDTLRNTPVEGFMDAFTRADRIVEAQALRVELEKALEVLKKQQAEEQRLETAAKRRANEVRDQYREQEKLKQAHADQVKLMGDQLAAAANMKIAAEKVLEKFGMMRTVAAGVADELARGAANAFAIANQGSPQQIAYGGRSTTSDKPVVDQYGNPVKVSYQNRPKRRPVDVDFGYYPDDTKTGGGAGATEKQDPLQKLKEQLALENELLGKTEAQKRVFQALGEDRAKYSQKEIEAVTAEIEAYNTKMEVMKKQEQIMGTVKSALEDGFMSMVDGTKSVKDAFKSMAADIIKELYRVLVVQRMVGAISGAVNMFSLPSGPSTGSFGLPDFRASGGSVMPGKPYIVGEHGPELVIPRHSGTVMNANQTASTLGGNGSGNVTVQNNITVTGSDAAMVRAEVAKMIPQITNATKAAVIDAKQRGGQMAAAFR